MVIKKFPEHKAKHVLFTPNYRGDDADCLAAYDIELDGAGFLKSSRRLKKGKSGSNVWYAYLDTNGPDPWFNDQTYVDTLSPDAMAAFIEITHEVYKDKIGDKFGSVVPCIFTDEPQFAIKSVLSSPTARHDVVLPWTPDLPQTFKKTCSSDLLDDLPELIWNLPDNKPSAARYLYHDHVCERFVSAFMDQIARWCKKNNLMLNGHMMEEPTLHTQTIAIGEAMRCYRSMEMPGMDLLVDAIEYNTAKQVSSVARQNGLRGAMSEIYGVTHWYFTFEGHKGCGDWQAALGITFRVHHLTWASMEGEGKRDYPACIGYQSPWYKEYGYVEDHFARVGVAMTRGKALTRVAVVHPIESYWLAFGPNGSGDELEVRDRAFSDLTYWLIHGLIDFDFISESLLPGQVSSKAKGKKLQVGKCEYDVVIVPNLRTIRSTTLKILQNFSKAGGQVIIAGSAPELIDAKIPKSTPVIENSKNVLWSWQSILTALDQYRDVRILTEEGLPLSRLLYQMREDGHDRYVFICNVERTNSTETVVELKGEWDVEKLDTFTGKQSSIPSSTKGGWTTFPHKFEGCASLLLRLSPSTSTTNLISFAPNPTNVDINTSSAPVQLRHVTLSEPNVLLLDYAEYKSSASATPHTWSPSTEILRIDNEIRSQLNIPLKGSSWRQPWTVPESERKERTRLSLRFTFFSGFTIPSPTQLALEDASKFDISINGFSIKKSAKHGYWVDENIHTLRIPPYTICEGENTVLLELPFNILTNLERIYILGDFFVNVSGNKTCLHQHPINGPLTFGSITSQGLPFYAGNVTYHLSFTIPQPIPNPNSKPNTKTKRSVTLHVPHFTAPLLTVHATASGEKLGRIAFQPRTLDLGELGSGRHEISVTAFGNRNNAFGHVHLAVDAGWCEPNMWRSMSFPPSSSSLLLVLVSDTGALLIWRNLSRRRLVDR
jgi:hypothetical protein